MVMQEHDVNSLDNFIMGWYSGDTAFCDELIAMHNNTEVIKTNGVVGLERSTEVDKSIKDSVDSNYRPDMINSFRYAGVLNRCLELYNEKYPESFCSGYYLKEPFVVQQYPVGGGYKKYHCERAVDRMPSISRHLVFMTYLNDVVDGGQTEFLYQKLKINAVKGLTLIWPSDWTFTHRGIVSPSEEKYIVTGWLNLK
jgi:hypothetical protein